jgi:phenylpyruvate tautomerase PptA (4-oxalocrotonate tautomerase family)
MSQIKIYGLKDSLKDHQTKLSDAIHKAVVQSLGLPVDKKFHRFISLNQSEFIFPADRSSSYTIIEISMFEGRSVETKKTLIRLLFQYIEQDTGIAPQDIEITIFESPKHSWGIRGQCGDELMLGYKVGV